MLRIIKAQREKEELRLAASEVTKEEGLSTGVQGRTWRAKGHSVGSSLCSTMM